MEYKAWINSYLVSQSRYEVIVWLARIRRNFTPSSHPTEIRASKDLEQHARNQKLALLALQLPSDP